MKLFPTFAAWLLLVSLAHSATVTFIQTAVNDADGTTIGALSSTQSLTTGVSVSTVTAPPTFSNYRFTHWTNSSYPAVSFRDAWGRSINPTPFLLLEATTATAHYLPETRDTDADGVPDWFEIEYYGNLATNAASDTDADGASLLAEVAACTNPLFAESSTEGGIAWADSPTIVVNLAAFATSTLRSEPAGTLNQITTNPPGTLITTPDYSGNPSFGYWKLDGLRQQDPWGVALTQISFTMATTNREAVAYFFAGDSDADGVPDAFEQFYYNTLANHAASDTDADGTSLLAESAAGTNPLFAESSTEGGIAWADSPTIVVNLAAFATSTLRSEPAGTLNQITTNPPGTLITTPDYSGNPSFGYWKLDGLRQQDPWGVALTQISFTMATTNREAVAYFFAGDSDADGVPDAFEQFYYNTLANHAASDTDADGVSLLAEYLANTNPLYAESSTEGGIAWADSSTVVVDLQPILTAPLSNAPANNPVTVAFTLLRTAQAGSVTLTFDDGVTLRPLTLATSQATSGSHIFTFNPANPTATAAIASGSAIPSGTYLVTLSYLDIQLNTVLNASSVGVVIAGNNQTPIEAWRQFYFGTSVTDTANNQDFNHNGINNLLEFAFATNPVTSTAAPLVYSGTLAGAGIVTAPGQPTVVLESTPTGVDFRALFSRRTDFTAAGLTYTVQFSPDLLDWTSSIIAPSILADNGTAQIVSVPFPGFLNGKKARFVRVQVSIVP